jgi:deoxyribose-phosphate aldolase
VALLTATGVDVGGAQVTERELEGLARTVVERFGRRETWERVRPSHERLAPLIDHTLLRPETTTREIDVLCEEALEHGFATVCVNGAHVPLCVERLAHSEVRVASVVGFPLGAVSTKGKALEAGELIGAGAEELDMVAAVGHLRDRNWVYVEQDIGAVVEAAAGRVVKVILETAVLEPLQIVMGALLAKRAGAGFVKTSTGFHAAGGATVDAVALLRLAVGDDLGVKAAGGIRDCSSLLAMLGAGATRIGTSSAIGLVTCIERSGATLPELVADPERHVSECTTVH